MKRLFLFLLVALLLAFAFPGTALAMGLFQDEPPTFEIPMVFEIALAGLLTYLLTHALQNWFPWMTGGLAVLGSALAATASAFLAGLINVHIPATFWPIVTQVLILLATWMSGVGIKQLEKRFRPQYILTASTGLG